MLRKHIVELLRTVASFAPLVGLVRRPPERPQGITACVRVKGDEEWIEPSLFYRVQYSTIDDFQQVDLEPRINQNLLLAHTDNDYTAHVFGVLVALRF